MSNSLVAATGLASTEKKENLGGEDW